MSQSEGGSGRCRNRLCTDPTRSVDRIYSIAVNTPDTDRVIKLLKYGGKKGWATVFGRLIYGYVTEKAKPGTIGLIVANPTYIGPGSSTLVRHTELVVERAATEDQLETWPWDAGPDKALVKTGPTPKSAGRGLADKIAAADALLPVLSIPDRSRTEGKTIIVDDDLCTTGYQLDRVARVLKEQGGATFVNGLTLARVPWG